MAEGDVNIPKVGPLPKKFIIPVAVAVAGFIGWRVYQSRKGTGADATSSDSTSDFASDGTMPSVLGAVSPTNAYGDNGNTDNGSNPGRFTTNAEWSNYVRSQLAGTYDDSAVVEALGNYLGSQPLSTDQQRIVRAAIAVGGYPPVGSFSIIPGGNSTLTIAPGAVHVESVGNTSATIGFTEVAGAASYRVFRNGVSANVGTSTSSPIAIAGLNPGTSYTVHVTAYTASGSAGPNSASVTFKTTAGVPGPITGRKSTSTKTTIHVEFKGAANATGYRVTLNGNVWSRITGSPFTIPNLKPNTSYRVGIRAVNATGALGPESVSTVRTKK